MKARKPLLTLMVAALLAAAYMYGAPSKPVEILLTNLAAAPVEGRPGALAVFMTIENGDGPDRLISASAPDATSATISGAGDKPIAIPADASPALAADGAHILLEGVSGAIDDGRLFPVTLEFEKAGSVSGKAWLAGERQEGAAHHYGLFGIGDICIVEEGEPRPAISLSATADGDGWHIDVTTHEFMFSKDMADGPHVPGTGHGHLYLNGLKLQRLYGTSAKIGALPPGTHEVTLTLNTNDHRAYVVDEVPVTASVTITSP